MMVVIAAGGEEHRLVAIALRHLEAEHVAIEGERPVEIGDLQVDMADARARMDRIGMGLGGDERRCGCGG
jgi:hypothetical protein